MSRRADQPNAFRSPELAGLDGLDWARRLRFGPIQGGVQVIDLSHANSPIGLLQPADRWPTDWEAKVLAISHWCDQGTVTFDINDSSGSILSAAITTNSTGAVERAGIIRDVCPAGYIELDVDSITGSPNPTFLRVRLLVANLGSLE